MKYQNEEAFEAANLFGRGMPNTAYAAYFDGKAFLQPLTEADAGIHISNVTFAAGCRNHWHIHHAKRGGGQVLLCIAGEGWYQEEGKLPISLRAGMTITIPAGVKHWHGAKADSWFSHIAIAIPAADGNTEWLEPVKDAAYQQLEGREAERKRKEEIG